MKSRSHTPRPALLGWQEATLPAPSQYVLYMQREDKSWANSVLPALPPQSREKRAWYLLSTYYVPAHLLPLLCKANILNHILWTRNETQGDEAYSRSPSRGGR